MIESFIVYVIALINTTPQHERQANILIHENKCGPAAIMLDLIKATAEGFLFSMQHDQQHKP